MIATMHREDVKAGIRKLFGSVAAFERIEGLPTKSVNEVLRGRANARVSKAIEKALLEQATTPKQSTRPNPRRAARG
jgi:lambda repressor-like predicted transcriptional regulator